MQDPANLQESAVPWSSLPPQGGGATRRAQPRSSRRVAPSPRDGSGGNKQQAEMRKEIRAGQTPAPNGPRPVPARGPRAQRRAQPVRPPPNRSGADQPTRSRDPLPPHATHATGVHWRSRIRSLPRRLRCVSAACHWPGPSRATHWRPPLATARAPYPPAARGRSDGRSPCVRHPIEAAQTNPRAPATPSRRMPLMPLAFTGGPGSGLCHAACGVSRREGEQEHTPRGVAENPSPPAMPLAREGPGLWRSLAVRKAGEPPAGAAPSVPLCPLSAPVGLTRRVSLSPADRARKRREPATVRGVQWFPRRGGLPPAGGGVSGRDLQARRGARAAGARLRRFMSTSWRHMPKSWRCIPRSWRRMPKSWKRMPRSWKRMPKGWRRMPRSWNDMPRSWRRMPGGTRCGSRATTHDPRPVSRVSTSAKATPRRVPFMPRTSRRVPSPAPRSASDARHRPPSRGPSPPAVASAHRLRPPPRQPTTRTRPRPAGEATGAARASATR